MNDRRSTEELSDFGFDAPGEPWLGELSQALTPPELGSIGEYEILGEVARGGQGVVYRARAAGTRRELALKRLVEGRLAAPATRRRFEREVEAAARLRHPGIVPVLGLDMVDGTPLLAMQWIDGVPVDEWARQCTGRDRFGRVVQLFLRVGDAVEHAHRLGVLHLDLKPSNVLVEPGDLPVVLDFGVARFTREDATASGSQDFLGTLAYASPEQVRGARSELDARSDVYSLGVLLYELLAGARPYAFGEGVGPALSLQERNQFPRLSAQVTGLSRTARRELDAIAGRALSAERSERYPTVAALCEDLRRLLEGRPVLAHPRSLSYELRKLARTHRAATVSAALFVLGTVAFAWYVEDRNRELERLRETEEQARTAAEESARAAQASALAADREAETRGQLLTFFFDELLRRALPTQPEADLTVRGLLELAAQRIEGHFSGRPEMEATMHAHLGMAFSNLGDLPSAEREFLRAIEGFADRPVDAARAQVSLANVRLGRGASSEEVLAMLEELEPFVAEFDLPTRYRYHSLRGQRLEFQRRLDEAADCFRQCCTIAIELDDEGQYGGALNDLGRCQAQAGRYTEARATYRQALRSFEAAGAGARDLLTSLQSDLSNLDQVEGYMVEAEELSRRSLEVVQELHGPLHPLVISGLSDLGEVLDQMGRLEEARPLLLEGERRSTELRGADSLLTLIHRVRVLRHELRRGNTAGALESLDQWTPAFTAAMGRQGTWSLVSSSTRLGVARFLDEQSPRVAELLAELAAEGEPRYREQLSSSRLVEAELRHANGDRAGARANVLAFLDELAEPTHLGAVRLESNRRRLVTYFEGRGDGELAAFLAAYVPTPVIHRPASPGGEAAARD